MENKVKEIFKHKGRICVVAEMKMLSEVTEIADFHNGYVETAPRNREKDYDDFIPKTGVAELTYSGSLGVYGFSDNLWFFGFDTNHLWNDENPESKKFPDVKSRTVELCDEMIEKGI